VEKDGRGLGGGGFRKPRKGGGETGFWKGCGGGGGGKFQSNIFSAKEKYFVYRVEEENKDYMCFLGAG